MALGEPRWWTEGRSWPGDPYTLTNANRVRLISGEGVRVAAALKRLQEVICELEHDVDQHKRDWKAEAPRMPIRYDPTEIEGVVADLREVERQCQAALAPQETV